MFYHEIIHNSDNAIPAKVIIFKNEVFNVPKHWHRSMELSFTYAGEIPSFVIDGQQFHTHGGDILIINSNQVHSVFFPIDTKYNPANAALTIQFPYEFLKRYIPDFDLRWYVSPDQHSSWPESREAKTRLTQLLTDLFQLMTAENKKADNTLAVTTLIFRILYLITENFSYVDQSRENNVHAFAGERKIPEIINFIQENFQKGLTVADIAEHFNFSTSYFSRMFKQNTASPVLTYLNNLRLQAAYQLLMNTSKTVSDIAKEAGFPNERSFIEEFKRKFQVTPLRFRIVNK